MDILSIIIIGIGLAMDCFAVSIGKGICLKKFQFGNVLRMAFLFGFFQAAMPLIGYFAGYTFAREFITYDHWIAFVLLEIIGIKMFVEGLKPIDPQCNIIPHPFNWKTLLVLAVATSIDALATGIVFVPFPDKIWFAIISIGTISFILTFIGVFLGIRFRKRIRVNVEFFGGLILILIGIKILVEHIYA